MSFKWKVSRVIWKMWAVECVIKQSHFVHFDLPASLASDADEREQETRKSRTRKLELRIHQSSRLFSSHRGAEIKDKVQHLICKLDWGFRIIPKVEQGCCERFENDSTFEVFPMKSHRKLFTNFSLPSLNVLTSTKLFHALPTYWVSLTFRKQFIRSFSICSQVMGKEKKTTMMMEIYRILLASLVPRFFRARNEIIFRRERKSLTVNFMAYFHFIISLT